MDADTCWKAGDPNATGLPGRGTTDAHRTRDDANGRCCFSYDILRYFLNYSYYYY